MTINRYVPLTLDVLARTAAPLQFPRSQRRATLTDRHPAWRRTEKDAWKQIEGLEQRKTPLSDHLLALFTDFGKRFVGVAPDFELMFERFEMLGALAHLERYEKGDVRGTLAGSPPHNVAFMPVGRAGWDNSNARKLVAELQADPLKWALVRAGFAKGDPEFFDLFIQNFGRFAERMQY
jgi:hypothetical protein